MFLINYFNFVIKMKKYINILKDIIREHPDDLPLHPQILQDKIFLGDKKRYYLYRTIINIPKHEISIVKIKKDYYKKHFIFEKKYDENNISFIKYKGEIIHIDDEFYNRLLTMWSNATNNERNKQYNKHIMDIILMGM